ncbi:MAG: N-acetylmuramoyl-L-alanine amidase [Chloroflexota bacterium]
MRQESSWEPSIFVILRFLGRNLPIVTFLILSLAGMLFTYWFFSPPTDSTAQAIALNSNIAFSAPIYKSIPDRPVVQRLGQSPGPLRIGIISGHLGSDSGAVCNDGLTEAEINNDIANQVANQLEAQGVPVDILEEFDDRLPNYAGTAVISIHADSCIQLSTELTGYKIAGSSFTESGQLFSCMEQSYQAATQLEFHYNTVTEHMTDYHVFRKLPTGVPAIIIEVGFMDQDRILLTTNSNVPAMGISNGIMCYIGEGISS